MSPWPPSRTFAGTSSAGSAAVIPSPIPALSARRFSGCPNRRRWTRRSYRACRFGCHGQTVGHYPDKRRGFSRETGATLQIGEPSFLAQRTGITTVSDFRPADLAAGGMGAPLVPAFHGVLLRGRGCFSSFQNIGGVGNVTVVSPQGKVMAAFDTGVAPSSWGK